MTNLKKNSGVTLIELLVSSSLFIVLVALASSTFIQALRTQRTVTNLSDSLNNISFATEKMAREVRTGFNFQGGNGEVSTLSFTNSEGDNVNYRMITFSGTSGIGECIGTCSSDSDFSPITSNQVNIDSLSFLLQGTQSGDGAPPRVTFLVSVAGEKDIRVNLQTTISSRIVDS